MQASNLIQFHRKPQPPRSQARQASLDFLSIFRQQRKPKVVLKSENIGPQEPAYLITELPNGEFKIYGIETNRVLDGKTAFTTDERKAIIEAMPMEEEFVSIERGFNLDADEENQQITVLLGDEWLFVIWVDEELETYMIERNEYLNLGSDIRPMIKQVAIAFREATEEE